MKPDRPWLVLNGVNYSLDQLQTGDFGTDASAHERNTLNFCHNWLNGQQEFQLQTSGSTGTPKNIIITRRQMEASALLTIKALHLKLSYTSLVCLDTKYIAGQMMLVRCLVLGMNMIVVDPSSNPFDKIEEHESIDFTALVPYQLQAILASPQKTRLNNLKCMLVGGAPLDLSLEKEIQSFACEIYSTYGMTETISHVALRLLNGDQRQDYFQTLEGINVGQDERGCLIIRAQHLGEEEIITNDIVSIIDQNRFRWLGRWDNVINTGGVKIMPEKVESEIQKIFDSLNLLQRFFVAGLPDEKLHASVALIVEGQPFDAALQSQLKAAFESKLDRYERPRVTKFILSFRETETGKINRGETLRLIPASSHDYES